MFLRLRTMYVLGALRRPAVHARLVPMTYRSFSTSIPRCTSAQPQQQAQKIPLQPTEIVEQKKSFNSLGSLLHPHTLKAITETPYKHVHMSPVQEKVLGMMSELVDTEEGKDLLVRAKTGTGKTLAFLVPGIERRVRVLDRRAEEEIVEQQSGGGAEQHARTVSRMARETMGVLVISPTRELATQIAVSASNLSVHHVGRKGFGVQLLVGGESRGRQMRDWVMGRKDVVVGTPGRLRDLLEGWNFQGRGGGGGGDVAGLKEVFGKSGECVVVLDEADTLLDMGFRSDVDAILKFLKKGRGAEGRQTWMFSATVGKGVEGIVREAMRKERWEYVDCVGQGEERDVHAHVRQVHTVVGDEGGMGALVHFLRLIVHDQLSVMKRNKAGEKGVRSKMLVFFNTTKMTRLFAKLLNECVDRGLFPFQKMRVYEMHAKKDMNDRVRISKQFRERQVAEDEAVVMVSSDVSARGVDYPGVGRVVQMGAPGTREGYVHRVGRTGRGDVKEGRGDLVLAPWEMGFLKVLGDVGMEPVTVEGLRGEVEGLAGELEGPGKYRELVTRVARIEDFAKNVASVQTGRMVVGEDEYRAAWASMVGFYIGQAEGLGAGGLKDIVEGSGRWVEALGGLEKGSLGVGPGSGLPRGVLDRLKRDMERGRGAKEKPWGTWSRNNRNEAPGGWSRNRNEGRNRSEGGWNRHEEGNRNEGGWNRSREEGYRSRNEEGYRNRNEGGFRNNRNEEGGWNKEGERKFGGMKAQSHWMGRGSVKARRPKY